MVHDRADQVAVGLRNSPLRGNPVVARQLSLLEAGDADKTDHAIMILKDQAGSDRIRNYGYKLAVKDITGRGIDQCTTYLAKVCDIVDPANLREWQEIKSFQLMRNIFVHRRGRCARD